MSEEAIPNLLLPEYPKAVEEVVCPDELPQDLSLVSCSLTISGYRLSVSVVGPDVSGALVVRTPVEVMTSKEVSRKTKERLDLDLDLSHLVECTPDLRIVRPGQEFECKVYDPDNNLHLFKAQIINLQGAFSLEILKK